MCTGAHPFIPVPDVAKVQMNYTYFNEKCMNVFHVRDTAGLSEETLTAIAEAFSNWHDVSVQELQPTTCSLDSIEVTSLDSEGDLQILYTTGLPRSGLNATNGMPGGTTVATKLSSAYAGRNNQGRSYWIGLGEDAVTANQLTTAVRTAIQNAYIELINAVEEIEPTAQLVVVSYCSHGAWRSTGQAQRIISASTDINIDSQRRRLTR